MNKRMNVLGIDPGLNGGLVLIGPNFKILDKKIMPTVETALKSGRKARELDLRELCNYLISNEDRIDVIYIEKIVTLLDPNGPVSRGSADFKLGKQSGALEAMCVALDFVYHCVHARRWQSVVKEAGNWPDLPTKKRAAMAIKMLYPEVDFRLNKRCKVPHDGMVDAALIAYYGRQNELK